RDRSCGYRPRRRSGRCDGWVSTDLDPSVHAALVTAGYRVTGPMDASGRGQVWALAADDGERAVATIVDIGADLEETRTLRGRVAALRALRHPHLALVRDVLEPERDRLVVITEQVVGTTVLDACRTRGVLRPGEGVTLAY